MKVFVMSHQVARLNAIEAVRSAPAGWVVEIKEQRRTSSQNAHLWAILGEIADQLEWHGQKLSPEDWKHILTAGLKKEQRIAPGVDGGFVVLGTSTSKMTKSELSELIEFAYAFGATKGVHFVSQSETA